MPSIQGSYWVPGRSISAAVLLEFKLGGWTQRGRRQEYFDLSNQGEMRPFEGLPCTFHMSQTSDDLTGSVVYTTKGSLGWDVRGLRISGPSGSQVGQFLKKILPCLRCVKINVYRPV